MFNTNLSYDEIEYIQNILKDPVVVKILSDCSTSTEMIAKTLFPERFKIEFEPKVHRPIFDLIDSPDQKVAIAAPRGYGKTSIVGLALTARYILFRLCEFICYINKSHDAASLQTENLRRELVTNKMIKQLFGNIKSQSLGSEFEEVFSKKAWVAYDTLVWPRGAGQQVRGVLYKNARPGLIIIDDLEDPKRIENEDYRAELYEWLYADVVKAVSRIDKNYKIVYIDTLKHEDSVLQKLLDSPDWKSVRLEACDDEFNPTAPGFMNKEDIEKEWNEHVKNGQTDVFFREFRNLPISTKDATFPNEYFRYYNNVEGIKKTENDLLIFEGDIQANRNIESFVILDPAKTVKIHSADSAILGLSIDYEKHRIYFRDAVSEKMYPDEIYNELFGMARRLNASAIGVEETSLNEFIKQPIRNAMIKRRVYYDLVWLKARGGMKKELRIKELVPYYRAGEIYHNARCKTLSKLEAQLRMFPRSALWDLMDCAAYLIEMLEIGERYFCGGQSTPEDIEAEYAELENEAALDGFRII